MKYLATLLLICITAAAAQHTLTVSSSPTGVDIVSAVTLNNPTVTADPQSTSALTGTSAAFSATATGEMVTRRWFTNGVLAVDGGRVSGATSGTLTISSLTGADDGMAVYCSFSNACAAAATATAALTITNCDLPTITVQPSSVSVETNGNAQFNVVATGPGLNFNWMTNGVFAASSGRVSGTLTSNLVFTAVIIGDSNTAIKCVVTNICGAVTSSVVTLTVTNGVDAGFTDPTSYPLMISWHVANYAVTNQADVPVVANDDIKSIGDKSGNQNVLTGPPSPSFVWKASVQNGLPAIEATGHESYLERATLAQGTVAQPITVYFVASYTTGGGYKVGFSSYRAGTTAFLGSDTDKVALECPDLIASSSSISSGWHVFTIVFDGATTCAYVDGVTYINNITAGAGSMVGLGIIGYQPATSIHWSDYFGECIIYGAHHDATQRANVESWLMDEWGL